MNDVQLIDFQGKRILYVNLGIRPGSNEEYWNNIINYILSQPLNSVLILMDTTDFRMSSDYNQFMDRGRLMKCIPHFKAQAFYGLNKFFSTLFKIFIQSHKLKAGFFSSKEAALDWLAKLE